MDAVWSATIAIAIVTAVLVAFARRLRSSDKSMKWPPGPSTLPIIGNMHQIVKGGDVIHIALTKLAKVHGRLMTVWFGSRTPTIIVSDYDIAWELLVSKSIDYADRQLPALHKFITADYRTIVSSNAGPHWQGLRKGLQSSGLGPLSVSSQTTLQESDMTHMINSMIKEASLNGGIVKPFPHIRRHTIRLLSRLCFGPDFSDESFDHGMDVLMEDALSLADTILAIDIFPLIRFIPSYKRNILVLQELKRRITKFIQGYLSSSPPPPNSYAHFLLSQNFPEDVVNFGIFEVFLLGLDSTGSTTMWALAFLVHNQDAQQKLFKEIRDNTTSGEKGVVKVEELGKLKYLQAVVKETMRMKPIAPLAVTHIATKDTMLNGNPVRQGTKVMVNIHAMHHDPKVWDEPYRFKPERFLENTMQQKGGVAEHFSFLPFGAGMRSCAGIEVGKLQLAFAVSNLVNALHWSNAVDVKMPDLSEEFTFILAMKNPLEARIVPRGNSKV